MKDGVSKIVCDKVGCERGFVKDSVCKMVCKRVLKESVSKMVCVCERWCVTKRCERWCVKDGG